MDILEDLVVEDVENIRVVVVEMEFLDRDLVEELDYLHLRFMDHLLARVVGVPVVQEVELQEMPDQVVKDFLFHGFHPIMEHLDQHQEDGLLVEEGGRYIPHMDHLEQVVLVVEEMDIQLPDHIQR
jgi:hypothetical protein